MARITEKEVHTAAAELDAQGVKPSTSKIREKLGSGSFSTIQKFLDTYDTTTVEVDEVPEFPEELKELLPTIWLKSWGIASGMFEAERLKFQAVIEEKEKKVISLEERLKESLEEIERLELSLSAEVSRVLEVKTERDKLNIQVEKQQVCLDSQEVKINELKSEKLILVDAEKKAEKRADVLEGKLEILLSSKQLIEENQEQEQEQEQKLAAGDQCTALLKSGERCKNKSKTPYGHCSKH